MPLLISNLSVPFDQPVEDVYTLAREKAKISKAVPAKCYIAKTSLDARKQAQKGIRRVYTIGIELASPILEEEAASRCGSTVRYRPPLQPLHPVHGKEKRKGRPVIIGFGPGGMFAALLLAREGYQPIVLERGEPLSKRIGAVERYWKTGILAPESNVQFGEGGAGTFSDGKLTTRIGDNRCEYVLREFYKYGAPEEILQLAKPHIGTDRLRKVVTAIREEILHLGGEIRFQTQLTGIRANAAGLSCLETNSGLLETNAAILAIGHSARDTFQMLAEQEIPMEKKPFSVGVRVEQLQSVIDKGLYGEFAGSPLLPKGEYQFSWRQGQEAVYTFCMCPGGFVVPAASELESITTNGMSEFARNQLNANSALVVSVTPEQVGTGILDGVAFQRNLEETAFCLGGSNGMAPGQDAVRFLNGKAGMNSSNAVLPSYSLGVKDADFSQVFDRRICKLLREGLERFERQTAGFTGGKNGNPSAVMTGVETRTSSPVRILRGEDFQSIGMKGLYPCGEGAGYAGGIMSAAVDGLRIAEAVISRFSEK
jgi:hypothetical protein